MVMWLPYVQFALKSCDQSASKQKYIKQNYRIFVFILLHISSDIQSGSCDERLVLNIPFLSKNHGLSHFYICQKGGQETKTRSCRGSCELDCKRYSNRIFSIFLFGTLRFWLINKRNNLKKIKIWNRNQESTNHEPNSNLLLWSACWVISLRTHAPHETTQEWSDHKQGTTN